ncbi:hypothetical protein AAFF_G00429700 [Aldrovandia affinis]|uniref:Uncharacterized protein n=1 Tax=Aldrovandia affinis TaxID=143900 RepID=A0AAD7WIC8_9TELE|nr:hypothetical protein AAFF_G00429700 [Aldrovandia affinis]
MRRRMRDERRLLLGYPALPLPSLRGERRYCKVSKSHRGEWGQRGEQHHFQQERDTDEEGSFLRASVRGAALTRACLRSKDRVTTLMIQSPRIHRKTHFCCPLKIHPQAYHKCIRAPLLGPPGDGFWPYLDLAGSDFARSLSRGCEGRRIRVPHTPSRRLKKDQRYVYDVWRIIWQPGATGRVLFGTKGRLKYV